MSKNNSEKVVLIIQKIELILKDVLCNFLLRDLETLLRANRMVFLAKKFAEEENDSKVKTFLYELFDQLKKKYEKFIDTSSRDVFREIVNEINNNFSEVFPNDYEEFKFRKLMEKTFADDKMNKIPYFADYEKLHNKNIKKY